MGKKRKKRTKYKSRNGEKYISEEKMRELSKIKNEKFILTEEISRRSGLTPAQINDRIRLRTRTVISEYRKIRDALRELEKLPVIRRHWRDKTRVFKTRQLVGEIIRLRDDMKLTNEDITQAVGVSTETLRNWELGSHAPSPGIAEKVLLYLRNRKEYDLDYLDERENLYATKKMLLELKALRKHKGLTIGDGAEILGVGKSQYSRIENMQVPLLLSMYRSLMKRYQEK